MSNFENEKILIEGAENVSEKVADFFKKAFTDMKESAKARTADAQVRIEAAKK